MAKDKQSQLELRKHYFNLEAEELLKNFSQALNNKNIIFWLEFGTLLGYYREQDFIKHDYDLDFGAYLKDASIIKNILESNGFKRIRYYRSSDGGIEECYRYKHTTLDVFYFREGENHLYCNSFTRAEKSFIGSLLNRRTCYVKQVSIPKNGFITTTYKGCQVNIPSDCVEHLKMHYGETFMTPNPNFDYKKEASNIKYFTLKENKGYLKIYGKKG